MKFLLFTFCLVLTIRPAFSQIDHAGSGRALYLDGNDDFVNFGDIFDDLELPFTVSAWINVDSDKVGHSPIFSSQDNFSLYNGFWLVINTTNIFVGYGDGKGWNNPAFRREKTARHPDIYGKWTHVCAVVRGPVDMDIYVNGIDIGGQYTGYTDYPMASNYPEEVAKAGYWYTNDVAHKFKGYMDDIRVWNYGLDQNQVREQMCQKLTGNESGLLAYWTFDEMQDDIVYDQGPNRLHGTLMNSIARVYSGAAIGDISIQTYGSVTGASFEVMDATVVSGAPAGVHIYKVLHPPSQVSGLAGDIPDSYYGAFFVNPYGNTHFELANCRHHHRRDNSFPSWSIEAGVSSFEGRVEAIFDSSSPLKLELGPSVKMCDGEVLTLSAGTENASSNIRWSTGETTSEISVTKSGTYKLIISDGCAIAEDSVDVLFTERLQPIDLGDDLVICPGQVINLSVDSEHGDNTVIWSNGATGSSIAVAEAGTYKVTVTNECDSFEDIIRISKPVSAFLNEIPNVITPNGDQLNQKFLVTETESGKVGVYIYNRWGREVYGNENYQNDWHGAGLSPGTYFYVLKDECGDLTNGTISILR